MRHFLLATGVALAGLTAAAPAFAQDTRAPFTGLRIEGLAGYDSLSDGNDQSASSSDGFAYGGAVGYDVAVNRFVLGAEGELMGSTVDTRTDNLFVANDRLRVDAGRDLYAGVRAGYVISPVAMAYVKAGYTNARVDVRYDAGNVSVRDGANADGFRVGAGLEYALGDSTFVKGEYRYSNYGNLDRYDVDLDRHQLVAGIGMRF